MIAYLQKSEGSEGFHQIIDFLTASHIKYALTENPTIYVYLIEQFWQTATASTLVDGDIGITVTIDGKVKVVSEASIRIHLKLEDSNGISTLSTTEIFKQLALMGASKRYTRVDTPFFQTMLIQGQTLQGEGSTIPVESHHTPTSTPFTSQLPNSSPSMPTTHVAEEAAPMPHDSPLLMVHSLRSDEGSLTLNELMVLCTSLSKKVESLESNLKQTKQTHGAAYTKLIMKVKKLEHKGRKIAQIDEDKGITLVQMGAQTQGRSDEDFMYETGVYDYPKGFTGPSISITTAEPVTTAGEGVSTSRAIPEEVSTDEPDMDVTLAEALVDLLKISKISAKDKGKAIMTEPKKPLKKKDQIQSDEELALRLHAEEQAEFERLQKERAAQEEASRASIYEEMDNIQAMIEVDEQLAARVQAEEQELFSIKEKSRLLVEMIAERKRFFAAQRAVEQRSKPPTKTQMRNRMCTYLKNMGGYKHNQLKGKSYEEIQKLFNRTYKQVNSFVPMASDDKEKGSEKRAGGSRKKTLAKKRAGEKQSEESSKRQKMENDAEKEELRAHLDIIPGDDVVVSVESLATKYPIVDWKTHVLSEDNMYYEIIRANGSSKSYKIYTDMLDDFDRQDVLDLYRLVKERFETASPEGYDRLLWGDLITVFEPKKTYPFTQEMLSRMLSGKLEVDNESEMAFELLRFTRSQIEK
ncbi:hypothetical protein Tco_1078221 [Tanacetum coccineum]